MARAAKASVLALACLCLPIAAAADAADGVCDAGGCGDDGSSLLSLRAGTASGSWAQWAPEEQHSAELLLGGWTSFKAKNTWTFSKDEQGNLKAEDSRFLWHIPALRPSRRSGELCFEGAVLTADDVYTKRMMRFRADGGALHKEWQRDGEAWSGPLTYAKCGDASGVRCF